MRTCEVVGYCEGVGRYGVKVVRLDEPRPDGCQYELRVTSNHGQVLTADLTQTICRMMEAEIAARSKSYLLACQRAGCQPAWSPPPDAGDPEPDHQTLTGLKAEMMAELKKEFLTELRAELGLPTKGENS